MIQRVYCDDRMIGWLTESEEKQKAKPEFATFPIERKRLTTASIWWDRGQAYHTWAFRANQLASMGNKLIAVCEEEMKRILSIASSIPFYTDREHYQGQFIANPLSGPPWKVGEIYFESFTYKADFGRNSFTVLHEGKPFDIDAYHYTFSGKGFIIDKDFFEGYLTKYFQQVVKAEFIEKWTVFGTCGREWLEARDYVRIPGMYKVRPRYLDDSVEDEDVEIDIIPDYGDGQYRLSRYTIPNPARIGDINIPEFTATPLRK
ncbi:hypothetical protein HYU13_04325 [Candidatus Woesearchaeota archaeon]|nr:hypothetical protein [Candidatus Woesearchaeota archaeon]